MVMSPMESVEPLVDSTPLLADAWGLRRRAHEDGYLFFRGLLPSAPNEALRAQVLTLCGRHGFLAPHTKPVDGKARPGPPVVGSILRSGPYYHFYRELLSLRSFHAVVHSPELIAAFSTLFGEPVLPHMRTIGRVVFPDALAYTTSPHQDHEYIRGTLDTWTCWVPLGDCPVELGPIAVLRGSHKIGLLPVENAFSLGGHRTDLPGGHSWLSSPLEAGDVVCFHSLTFHQARDNVTRDRLRLSLDCRIQPRSHPIDPSSQRPHLDFCTRDEVLSHWREDDPLYQFWRAQPIR
jgi:hypothetical protein